MGDLDALIADLGAATRPRAGGSLTFVLLWPLHLYHERHTLK